MLNNVFPLAADPEALLGRGKCQPKKISFGILQPNSTVTFEKAATSVLILTGRAKV